MQQSLYTDRNPALPDVKAAFDSIRTDPRIIEFNAGGWDIHSGGHLQGIQRHGDHFVVSGSSSDEAYLLLVGEDPNGYAVKHKKVISGNP